MRITAYTARVLTRGRMVVIAAAVVMTAVVVWVLFFYGIPGDAGQVPR